MRTFTLVPDTLDDAVQEAAQVLREGKVVIYPTDTLYGLGADAFSDEAFEKVCMIKERDERRPVHAVFADLAMAEAYAELTPTAQTLAQAFLPGPLTLVLKKKKHLTTGIARSLDTVGVRIPKHDFCLTLAAAFGRPYTTTSANVSGEESPATLQGIIAQLGERAAHVALAIDGGAVDAHLRSTVVDARATVPHILREGAITERDIRRALGH